MSFEKVSIGGNSFSKQMLQSYRGRSVVIKHGVNSKCYNTSSLRVQHNHDKYGTRVILRNLIYNTRIDKENPMTLFVADSNLFLFGSHRGA